jgi:hypothetical protein
MSLVLLLAAAAALGRLAGRILPMGAGVEGWVFRLASGLSGSAVLVLVVGAHSLLAAQVTLFGTALAGAAFKAVGRVGKRSERLEGGGISEPEHVSGARPGIFEWACFAVTALGLAMAFFAAWAPASDPSSTGGTLLLAKGHALAGDMKLQPQLPGSGDPPLMTALYAAAFYGSGERPAVLLAWVMGLLACAAAYALGRRMAGARAGAAAAAVFACMPVFFDQASTTSAGLAQALFVVAALAAVLAWIDEGDSGRLALAGWMAGSSVGVSHACAPFALLLPMVMVFGAGAGLAGSGRGARLRGAMVLALATALAAAPFLLRTWLVTGDPVYPWFQSVFPAKVHAYPYVAAVTADPAFARDGFRWVEFLRYPWDVIMRPLRFGGWTHSPGGLLLALGVPGLLYGGRRAWMTALPAVAGGAALWFTHRGALAALPYFALMTAVCGVAVMRLPRWRGAVGVALLTGCLFGLVLHAVRLRDQAPVLLGQETRDAYLARRAPRHGAWAAINSRAARVEGARVLVLDGSAYFADAPVCANNNGLRVVAQMQGEEQLKWLQGQGVGLIVVPGDLLREDSPLFPEVRAMIAFWKSNSAVFPAVEHIDLPRVAAKGVERVEVLAFMPNQ